MTERSTNGIIFLATWPAVAAIVTMESILHSLLFAGEMVQPLVVVVWRVASANNQPSSVHRLCLVVVLLLTICLAFGGGLQTELVRREEDGRREDESSEDVRECEHPVVCGVWCVLWTTSYTSLTPSSFVFLPQVPDGVPNPGENCELASRGTNTLLNGTSASGGMSEQNTTDTVGLNLACQQPGLWGRAYTPGWEVPYYLVALVGVLFGLQVRVVPTHYSHVSFEIESDHFVNDVNRFSLSCTAVRVTLTSPRSTLSRLF